MRSTFESLADSEAIAAIDTLPEERLIAFLLVAVERFASKEINSMLAIPIGEVISLPSSSRAELRTALSHLRAGDREDSMNREFLRRKTTASIFAERVPSLVEG